MGNDFARVVFDLDFRPLFSSLSMMVVSTMSNGAGSVAVSARPILPKT
jgi:hypothetical protein